MQLFDFNFDRGSVWIVGSGPGDRPPEGPRLARDSGSIDRDSMAREQHVGVARLL